MVHQLSETIPAIQEVKRHVIRMAYRDPKERLEIMLAMLQEPVCITKVSLQMVAATMRKLV